tara:strand:+ start:194 stop:2041 length:1848 start_codon:yes stop_codon:yes gene_type:complete
MTDHYIKNEQWYVKDLISKIDNTLIKKPQYQRKRKWDITHKKENTPNEKSYIEFLFKKKNSVHAITFGQETFNDRLVYSNIDGNNRINAIYRFLKYPFKIFAEYLNDLNNIIDLSDNKRSNEIKEIFSSLSYTDFIKISRLNKFFDIIGKSELYGEMDKVLCDNIDDEIANIQTKLKIDGEEYFDKEVIINVNIFEGYTTEQLCETFEEINKYNSKLTETELLSCRLYSVTDFSISDNIIKTEIDNSIKKYYIDKSNGETLDCYQYTEDSNMNAHDFIMGLHTLHNEKYNKFIDKPGSDGLSLYFKLWTALYDYNTFTEENVNNFIKNVIYCCEIFNEIYDKIFTDKINDRLFKQSVKNKIKSLKKNNMFIIFCFILGSNNKGVYRDDIISKLERALLYHFFTSDIKDKDKRDTYKNIDRITFNTGSAYIKDLTKNLLKNPDILIENISKNVFSNLLKDLFNETNNPYERKLDNGNLRNNKRRSLKYFEKTCMFYYFKEHMPTKLLDNEFSIEHIIPHSSEWENILDKDRSGNLFPILSKINSSRGNRDINYYKKTPIGQEFINFVKDIIPTKEQYAGIIRHENKPIIIDNNLYNEMCEKNERIYADCILRCLFS